MHSFSHIALLFGAALLAGALNAVAGGGSFFSFPALLFIGLDPKIANATNCVALWPGSVASVGAFRRELETQQDAVRSLAGVSLVGGLAGALLLLVTPSSVFKTLLPYLMLGATLIFVLSPRINAWVRRSKSHPAPPHPAPGEDTAHTEAQRRAPRWRSVALQGLISVYGGYFGGGIGILMLAALALMGMEDIHEMNALKTFLASVINGIAVVTFIIARAVAWPEALLMIVAAIAGGYWGAALSRRVQPALVRRFVVVTGFAMSAYLFLRS